MESGKWIIENGRWSVGGLGLCGGGGDYDWDSSEGVAETCGVGDDVGFGFLGESQERVGARSIALEGEAD